MKRFFHWLKGRYYIWWTALLPFFIFLFVLVERCITTDYHSTVLPIDGYIPFFAPAVIPYVLWYPMLVGTGLWLIWKDGRGYRKYMLGLTLCYLLSVAVYFLWPNGQDLRPDLTDPGNVFEWLLSLLYAADTNTNVFPSLHVSCAAVIVFAWWESPAAIGRWRCMRSITAVMGVLVSFSTVLVKQHAAVDIFGGVAVALLCWAALYLRKRTGERREFPG